VSKKNKTCVINDNIVSNRKEEDEKKGEMNIEDDGLKKIDFFDLKYNQMTCLDSLK